MGKWYAYCPRGFVELIEKRTENYDEPYPIGRFYHGALLPYFKKIPEDQKGEVKVLWYWNESDNRFAEPQVGTEVDGQLYIGTIPKDRIYEILQDNLRLSQENLELNAQLTDTQLALCDSYELTEEQATQVTDLQMAICDLYETIETIGGAA